MASFDEHIKQAHRNLCILSHTNATLNDAWDWQVTMCFYVAVHLVNAHIAQKEDKHYLSHKQVKNALNPYKQNPNGTELEFNLYKCYVKLQNLSRRSRYLCLDADFPQESDLSHLTYDKHLAKALYNLDNLLQFISKEYGVSFNVYEINCIEIKGKKINHFKYIQPQQVV